MKVCIEIELETDDGTFTVSQCDPSEDAPEQAPGGMPGTEAGGETENDGQKFGNIKDALLAAAKLLTFDTRSTQAESMQTGYDRVAKPMRSMGGGMQGKMA